MPLGELTLSSFVMVQMFPAMTRLAVRRLRGLLNPLEGRQAQSVGNNTGANPH